MLVTYTLISKGKKNFKFDNFLLSDMAHVHKLPSAAIIRVIQVIATVLVFFEYSFSWRKDVLYAIGAWHLGFLEGIIIATIMAVIVYVVAQPIMSILRSLIELGSTEKSLQYSIKTCNRVRKRKSRTNKNG